MRFERPQFMEEGDADKPAGASKRTFLRGAFGFGAMTVLGPQEILAAPDTSSENSDKLTTWTEGAKVLRETAQRPNNPEIRMYFVPDKTGERGVWFTETDNEQERISISDTGLEFVAHALAEHKEKVVKCHIHPPQVVADQAKTPYTESDPPSFVMALNEGDALTALVLGERFENKIGIAHKVFDSRGVWTYGVDSEHPFWIASGLMYEEAEALNEAFGGTSDAALRAWEKMRSDSGITISALEKLVKECASDLGPVLVRRVEHAIGAYERKIGAPFGHLLEARKKVHDEFILASLQTEHLDWKKLKDASAELGVQLMFQTYQELGL